MGSIRLVVTVIAISLSFGAAVRHSVAQSSKAANISTATPEIADDQAFARYQRVTSGIVPPKATHSPDPPYPELPPDIEPRGVVVMLIGVDAHGHVGPVRVVRSSAQAFEKSAVATVKTWKFKPARKDGQPVPVQITVEMTFAK
jgi:TonB family protein